MYQVEELEDFVALNETDKSWIRETIENSHKLHGWSRLARFIKDWSGTGAVVAIVLFFILQYTAYVEFRTTTGYRLDQLEIKLRVLSAAQLPAKVLGEIATLDVKHFAQNLPALQKVSEQPVSTVNPSPTVLKDVIYRLKNVSEDSEGYWPAALSFIKFATDRLASNAPARGSGPEMVFDHTSMVGNGGIDVQPRSIIRFDGATITDMTFVESRIIFTNNPTHLKNVHFINCAFEFPDSGYPSPSLRQTGRELLASDFQKVSEAGI